jgi:hypothetical protein
MEQEYWLAIRVTPKRVREVTAVAQLELASTIGSYCGGISAPWFDQ